MCRGVGRRKGMGERVGEGENGFWVLGGKI